MDKKKNRAENWSREEKDILIHLIKDSRGIIENKNTDTNTNREKSAEWNMIHQKFTKLTGKKRLVAQLKGQWRRMKLLAKKNIAHQRAMYPSGGGEKPPSPSPEDQEIMHICPVDFLEAQIDSDAIQTTINYLRTYVYDPLGLQSFLSRCLRHNIYLHAKFQPDPSNSLGCVLIDHYMHLDDSPVELGDDDYSNKKNTAKKKNYDNGELQEKCTNESNKDCKEKLLELRKKEIDLRILYQERELQQQSIRHKLETEALQLEVEIKKKRLCEYK